ncbi:MAG TPA: cyclic nucleotide-binding domain-containing protein [Polyangia bacterium]|nr:cyclic nucleotide-binding domain-containing protein [Polyangia bacterium]
MGIKLGELKAEARTLLRAGETGAALAAFDHILASNPLDYDSRLKIADLLSGLGDREGAAELYRALALHDIRSGHALPAFVAIKQVEALGGNADELVDTLSGLYAHGAPTLAKFAARQAPVDMDSEVPRPDLSKADDVAAIAARARARALDFSVFVQYPEQFLPLPFFSELPREVFRPVARALRLRRMNGGDFVIREGEPGVAFYLVATGQVRVFATQAGKQIERGRLHEGALFGEMSLLTQQPRTASVQVVDEADILELSRESLAVLTAEVPSLGVVLDKFARERLLKNLLATSPLFRPFNHQQQLDLIRRFDGHEIAAGTVVIREGDAGQGLFVVLSGEVEVSKRQASGGELSLARLRAGDVFGEMSLLSNQPTSATVTAARDSTILFLARDYFQRLIEALPTIRQYFVELAQRRAIDTNLAVGQDEEMPARMTSPDARVIV